MDKLKMHSPDLSQDNIAKIRELFPDCVTEGVDETTGQTRLVVDFDQLRQELSDHVVEGAQERYRLDWPGKREACAVANAPVARTLRPCMDESVNFQSTKNLFIEGDNLDALKLLQETYLGKIKMIYIDPPYNTGNDFVYADDFSDSNAEFLIKSNQVDDEGNRLSANPDVAGRLHSNWLSMIYPRLRMARNLLSRSGVIFVSIDDKEVHNLRKVCDEVFGEGNFVADLIWQSRTSISDDHEISLNHNHTIIYARDYETLTFYGEKLNESEYENRDNDPRGPWKLVPLDANKPGGNTNYPIRNPNTGEDFWPPSGRSWSINPETFRALQDDNRVAFGYGGESAPKRKLFLNERLAMGHTKTPSSLLLDAGTTKDGSAEVAELLGGKKIFSYPKPVSLMERLIQYGVYSEQNQIVLDFFAGSGTTAHAVLKRNARENTKTQFISIQLPEPVPKNSDAHKAGFANIAEISKERIRRAGSALLNEDHHANWDRDIGFRVLKVDSSNLKDIYYKPDEFSQQDLLESVDNVKDGRSAEDLLFQVLVDWGVDLTLPIRSETVHGKSVFFVDENALVACFDAGMTEELVKELAGHEPLRVVFRDNGFASDAVKINVEQIFRQLSPSTEVKSI